jgi:hypothetical protein
VALESGESQLEVGESVQGIETGSSEDQVLIGDG